MKQKNHFPNLIALAGIALATSAHGQLFSDDFESYTVDTKLDASGPWLTVGSGASDVFVRNGGALPPFGTSNQYLDFNDNTSSSVRIQTLDYAAASGAVTTYSLDFNEPDTTAAGTMIVGYSITGGDLNSAGSRLTMNLDDGNITGLSGGTSTYSLDTSYRLYIVFNDTAASVSYNGGSNSVAAGTADVWIEPSAGPAVFAGTRTAVNSQTTSYRVGLRGFSSNLQQVLVDNVALSEGVALPGNPPTLVSTSPVDDSTTALVSTNLVADFNVPVMAGTGNIIIKEVVGDATVATLDVTGPAVTFSGTTVTVDLPSDLALSSGYYVLIDGGAITELSGSAYAGIIAPDVTTWNFETAIPSILALQTSADSIRGRAEAATLQYLAGSGSTQVGIGGAGGNRQDYNVVLGFTLPTLPVGETISSANFDFEIKGSRETGNNPALHVYLVDEENPDASGISLFYHGPSDPSTDVAFVGAINLADTGQNNTYADDTQDQSIALTGDALALLQSYYGGDNSPDRTEAFFRFNLDQLLGGATINNFERYFIDKADDESVLSIVSGVAAPFDAWAAGFTPNPGAITDNPDADSLDNLLEFAFGTNPNVSDASPLVADGSVNGLPIAQSSGGAAGVTFSFTFVRRDDHATSGSISYTPQFSNDLVTFYDSMAIPTVEVDSTDDAAYEVVSVPYPFLLPNGKKARFARVLVEITP
jgi:hypothetical protein